MLIIITIISVLVGINFILLIFSCNKTTKKEVPTSKVKAKDITPKPTIQHSPSSNLAPTGS